MRLSAYQNGWNDNAGCEHTKFCNALMALSKPQQQRLLRICTGVLWVDCGDFKTRVL